MFLARETHMHSFFNFHIPKYFPVSPIFPNSLLNLIGACLSACRDSQHMFVCFVCWIVFEFFLLLSFSVDVMTQALFYSQGMRAFPFATFTTYHHLDNPPPPPSFYCTTDKHYWLSFLFRCTTNISGTMLILSGIVIPNRQILQEKGRQLYNQP